MFERGKRQTYISFFKQKLLFISVKKKKRKTLFAQQRNLNSCVGDLAMTIKRKSKLIKFFYKDGQLLH